MSTRKEAVRVAAQTEQAWSARGLEIVDRDPRILTPRTNNPRKHTDRQIKQLAASITEFGFLRPVLTDSQGTIVAGHAATLAAIDLGLDAIPTVVAGHLTPAQIRGYVIADNRIAELAGWDRTLLAIELQALTLELNFDVTVTGFETAEIDVLISEINTEAPDTVDETLATDRSQPALSQLGDVWIVGDHRLYCGDATKRESYGALLGDERAQMVFTDAPYNVRIDGHVSGSGKIKHPEFAMASGEMSREAYTGFLKTVFRHLADFSIDGSIHFQCIDWRHVSEMIAAGEEAYTEQKNICVWTKTNGGMGSLYRSQHEFVLVFKSGKAAHINNVELGRFGRSRSNVWPYAGASSFGKDRDAALAMHPTVKPVALVADAILDCSKRGGLVLDAFAGSGTTLIAAEKTGRKGRGIELDPYYVDTILTRFDQAFGLKAAHAATGVRFDDLRAEQESQ